MMIFVSRRALICDSQFVESRSTTARLLLFRPSTAGPGVIVGDFGSASISLAQI